MFIPSIDLSSMTSMIAVIRHSLYAREWRALIEGGFSSTAKE